MKSKGMAKIEIINKDFRECEIPKGLVITDPPYNQGYSYNEYQDRMSEEDYITLLSKIVTPVLLYPISLFANQGIQSY